ncbi:MAG: GNAT family N-acetyltransferase [Protaetiibacter sp.]
MAGTTISPGGGEDAVAESPVLAAIWGTVFAQPPYAESADAIGRFESERLLRHAGRDGFAIAIARDPAGEPVGFAYGMTGIPASWWSGYLRERVDPALVDAWVPGAFELAELALLPRYRGQGVGRSLLATLLVPRAEPRVVCQTVAEETPARALYRSLGFRELASFERWVLLGRELPVGPDA